MDWVKSAGARAAMEDHGLLASQPPPTWAHKGLPIQMGSMTQKTVTPKRLNAVWLGSQHL